VCTENLNTGIMVMKSTQDGVCRPILGGLHHQYGRM
jgi:hypothetical protein